MDEADPASVAGFFYEDKNPPAYMPMVNAIIIKKFISDDIS